MKLDNNNLVIRRLLGYFMTIGNSGACEIYDSAFEMYIEEYGINYGGSDDCPQTNFPIDSTPVRGLSLPPKFYEQGYVSVNVYPSFKLRLNKRVETEFPEYNDIPIYLVRQNNWQLSVVIELDEWIQSLEIPDEDEEYEKVLYQTFPVEVVDASKATGRLPRKLFGHVTAIEGGIFICETSFLYPFRKDSDFSEERNQVVVSGNPCYRGGIRFYLPEELKDKEFPVFGEYEGDFLKRIVIEIASGEEGEKVWNYNFSDRNESIVTS